MASAGYLPPLSDRHDQPCKATGQKDTPKRLQKDERIPDQINELPLRRRIDQIKKKGKAKTRALGGA